MKDQKRVYDQVGLVDRAIAAVGRLLAFEPKKAVAVLVGVLAVLALALGAAGGFRPNEFSPASGASSSAADADASTSAADATVSATIRFLDVGQGDATLVESAGHWLLIDGGAPQASQKVYATLKALGVPKLDAIIATHPDADHIGGLSGALICVPCGALYCSVASADTETFASMVKYNQSNGTGIIVPASGDSFRLGDATATFVQPKKELSGDNNKSLVTRVDFGGHSLLVMGDAETDAEKALLAEGAPVRADILRVSHHGSLDATSEDFLRAVAPQYAVISVGANNDYGHPSERVLERLQAASVGIYRTDQLGDIVFTCAGGQLEVATQKTVAASPIAPGEGTAESQSLARAYVLNTNSMKFHYPDCRGIEKMAAKNRRDVEATREEVRSWGYDPCGICNP